MKIFRYILTAAFGVAALTSCTDLDETLYDQVGTQNYYNTKMDVVRATFRPFEHAFWSIQSRHVLNELSADQLITPTRDGWWDDGGKWRRLHYHEWNVEDGGDAQTEWNGCFQGIMQANYVIEDLNTLQADKFGFSQAEFDNLKAQCRVLRAWFYIRLLDAFRNVPLAVSYNDVSLFYYSGHGANSVGADGNPTSYHAALVGTFQTYVSIARLKTELDKIPGKKVIIIDACHSGQFIARDGAVTQVSSSAFNSQVVNLFANDDQLSGDVSRTAVVLAADGNCSARKRPPSSTVRVTRISPRAATTSSLPAAPRKRASAPATTATVTAKSTAISACSPTACATATAGTSHEIRRFRP